MKLINLLIIFLIIIINYKHCGYRESYNINGIWKGDNNLYLFFQYGSYHLIPLDNIESWEIKS